MTRPNAATTRLWPSILAAAFATSVLAMRPATTTRVAIRVAPSELAESLALDVWTERRAPGMPIDIVVDASALPRLSARGIEWQVLVPDIDAVAEAEAARLAAPQAANADWFAEYKDYAAISEHIAQLAQLAPDRVSLHGIGSSIDGRTIWALRIGNGPTPMLINGTQHAREWIAAMTTTCVADRMVRDYDRDPKIRAFVDSTTLWVVPVVNPDGYQYSWSSSRYWRKNRRGGYGVDLNRNWSVAFGGAGSSSNKRSDIYRGEYAFSEPESAAVRDLARRTRPRLAIDFHSYGQLVLYPWNYTAKRADDHDKLTFAGDKMASAMFAQHGERYRLMSGVELYPASGTAQDFMYGDVGALAYTIELRPKGRGGFVLPPEQIRPTCDEGLAAVLALRATANGAR
ncbi:MAG: M14 family metallopeptidase [Kofleriaceae bacterium]